MRLAVLGNERLRPAIHWTTLGPPFLRALAGHPGAELLLPPPLDGASLREWRPVLAASRQADTVFWMQMSGRPEPPVWLASAARLRRRRSAFVVDAWRPSLERIGWLAARQRLDPCFVAMREAAEELERRHPGGRFEWLPFGVDTEVFTDDGGERDIFAYWMGRRHEPLHRALAAYCAQRGLTYRYTAGGEVTEPADLGRLVARARYFVVTPPDLDDPVRTGGFSPLVMRYLEGLAAGARLLGVLPRSGEYEDLLPVDAICQVAPDGSDLRERLDADRRDPSTAAAVRRAQSLVRAEHSWSRRAEQVHERLGR